MSSFYSLRAPVVQPQPRQAPPGFSQLGGLNNIDPLQLMLLIMQMQQSRRDERLERSRLGLQERQIEGLLAGQAEDRQISRDQLAQMLDRIREGNVPAMANVEVLRDQLEETKRVQGSLEEGQRKMLADADVDKVAIDHVEELMRKVSASVTEGAKLAGQAALNPTPSRVASAFRQAQKIGPVALQSAATTLSDKLLAGKVGEAVFGGSDDHDSWTPEQRFNNKILQEYGLVPMNLVLQDLESQFRSSAFEQARAHKLSLSESGDLSRSNVAKYLKGISFKSPQFGSYFQPAKLDFSEVERVSSPTSPLAPLNKKVQKEGVLSLTPTEAAELYAGEQMKAFEQLGGAWGGLPSTPIRDIFSLKFLDAVNRGPTEAQLKAFPPVSLSNLPLVSPAPPSPQDVPLLNPDPNSRWIFNYPEEVEEEQRRRRQLLQQKRF